MWYTIAKYTEGEPRSPLLPEGLDDRIKRQWSKDNKDSSNDPKWGTGDPNVLYLNGWLISAIERLGNTPEASVRAIQGLKKFMSGLGFHIQSEDQKLFSNVMDAFFKNYPNFNRESIESELKPVSFSNTDHIIWAGQSGRDKDNVSQKLIQDIESAARESGVAVSISRAITGHSKFIPGSTSQISRHSGGNALDINGFWEIDSFGNKSKEMYSLRNNNPKFVELGNRFSIALAKLGYQNASNTGESGKPEAFIWQVDKPGMGNHYNHIHVSVTP